MKEVQIGRGKYVSVNWQSEETLKEHLAGFVEALWNWGIPVFTGILAVTHHPAWILVSMTFGIFRLQVNFNGRK